MKKTSKILLVLGVLLISTTLASAALLQYFGKVTTSMNVKQSIVIGDGDIWYNYDQPITRNIGDVVHCTDYCYKLLIINRACKDATVSIVDTLKAGPNMDSTGIDIGQYVFGDSQTIQLVQKNVDFGVSPWTQFTDGMEATLTFNTCGTMLDWSIESTSELSEYSLIYYANYPTYWTAGPVTVIGTGASGSYDGQTIPFIDDENAKLPISRVGESYTHQYGAKFWLVPTDALVQGQNGWDVDWTQAEYFLFETDLSFYLDCDDMTPECMSNVFNAFDTTILKAESEYCWISCYHVAFDIIPGTYTFDTIVDAAEILPQV